MFAAASLADVLDRLGEEFTERDGARVRFNLGGSTSLSQQIIRGAPADAFISAGPQPMDSLEEQDLLVAGTRADLLTNELVVVGPADLAERRGIRSLEDLAGADVRVSIAAPELAPAGRYAREALESLGLWERLRPRMVYAPNVRVALTYVETGNVDAGIVYLTDIRTTKSLVPVLAVPEESHSPIVYPAAVVKDSTHAETARRFLVFLQGEEAGRVFVEHGFAAPGGERRSE